MCLNELKIHVVSIETYPYYSVLYHFSYKLYIVCHAASACQAKLLYISIDSLWAHSLSPPWEDKGGGGGGGLEPAEPYASYAPVYDQC